MFNLLLNPEYTSSSNVDPSNYELIGDAVEALLILFAVLCLFFLGTLFVEAVKFRKKK